MSDLIVHPTARPLVGIVPVPADDEIGRLTLLLAALGSGVSEVQRVGGGAGVSAVIDALAQLGVRVERTAEAACRVHGRGLRGLSAAARPLDVGASYGAMCALAGVLVAQTFSSVLIAEGAWSARDVADLAGPLRLRGARIEGVFMPAPVGAITLPLHIGALPLPHMLGEIEHVAAHADADIKTALLLSGLFADGSTFVSEPLVSRDHVERLLQALDLPLSTVGPMVHLESRGWEARWPTFHSEVPGDFAAAAVLLAAALLVPGSRVGARGVGLNRTRTGFLEIAQHMGASFEVEVHGNPLNEPVGVAMTSASSLIARDMEGEMMARASSEIPALIALAARARGASNVAVEGIAIDGEASGTRDRLVAALRAFEVSCEPWATGITVLGRPEGTLRAADVPCSDPHVAVLALLLALVADGPSRLRDVGALGVRYPRLVGTLRALGADLHVEKGTE